jgi:hypothetical protein
VDVPGDPGKVEAVKRKITSSPMTEFLRQAGKKLQVIRPNKPELALQIMREAQARDDLKMLEQLPALVEEQGGFYMFVGYACVTSEGKAFLGDEEGKKVGELQPGDSYVTGLCLELGQPSKGSIS